MTRKIVGTQPAVAQFHGASSSMRQDVNRVDAGMFPQKIADLLHPVASAVEEEELNAAAAVGGAKQPLD